MPLPQTAKDGFVIPVVPGPETAFFAIGHCFNPACFQICFLVPRARIEPARYDAPMEFIFQAVFQEPHQSKVLNVEIQVWRDSKFLCLLTASDSVVTALEVICYSSVTAMSRITGRRSGPKIFVCAGSTCPQQNFIIILATSLWISMLSSRGWHPLERRV